MCVGSRIAARAAGASSSSSSSSGGEGEGEGEGEGDATSAARAEEARGDILRGARRARPVTELWHKLVLSLNLRVKVRIRIENTLVGSYLFLTSTLGP